MSNAGSDIVPGDGGTPIIDSSVPYATVNRRERSRKLAQRRRDTYKSIMDELIGVLPFPKESISQLDYNSRLRLALCFLRMKTVINTGDKVPASASHRDARKAAAYSKQIIKKRPPQFTKPTLFHPGMLQDLMSEALDGFMMVIQIDGTVVFLSDSIHKYLGLFQSEYIGMGVYDLILEEDHDEVRRKISEAEAKSLTRTTRLGTTSLSFFCRMKCSRGKVANTITRSPGYKLVYVSGTLKVSKDEPFIACMVHPVSPPSILELRMEGNMFVTHYSMDMTCLFFDGRLRQLLGYSKQDLVGSTPFNLHHHADTEATLQCSRGVMSRGEGLSGYYRFLNHFGEYVWLQTRATLMYDSRTGLPSYIVCMNFIISKEDGSKDLEIRQAITSGDSNISSDADHAHDPFPLAVREDDKVVNPFVFDKDDENTSADDLSTSACLKQEEPSSTVEVVDSTLRTGEPRKSSVGSCVSSNSTDNSATSSSVLPPTSVAPEAIRLSSTRHSVTSSVSSSMFQPSPEQNLRSASFANEVHSCQPDSTTVNVSRRSRDSADSQNTIQTNSNLTTCSDLGYHSESSSSRRPMASTGNESEMSGSSGVRRSSPESSLYTAFSPEYPQSVFSYDGSIPPPLSHTSRVDSPGSDSHSTLHHPSSQIQSQVRTPATPETTPYPLQAADHFQAVSSKQFITGDINRFPMSGNSQQPRSSLDAVVNSSHGSYGSPGVPRHGYGMTVNSSGNHGNVGGAPFNLLPDWNSRQVGGSTFAKVNEPFLTSRTPYSNDAVTTQHFVATPSNVSRSYVEQTAEQNGFSAHLKAQAVLGSQPQMNPLSLFPVGSTVQFKSSAPGDSSHCHVTIQSSMSDLPQLTVDDLKMLDAFADPVSVGEDQFGLIQTQPRPLNWNGTTAI